MSRESANFGTPYKTLKGPAAASLTGIWPGSWSPDLHPAWEPAAGLGKGGGHQYGKRRDTENDALGLAAGSWPGSRIRYIFGNFLYRSGPAARPGAGSRLPG